MAVVSYYNKKGYNELSKKAEAALGNIQDEICDKFTTEQILCKLIAEYKFDKGILEFSVANPSWDNGVINNSIKHYVFYNEAYYLGSFIMDLNDLKEPSEYCELYLKSQLRIIWAGFKYHTNNSKFIDKFILNRINKASPEAPLPTLNLRVDTFILNVIANKFKKTHEQHWIPTQPLYIPILNGKEHVPFWEISENDFKINKELLKSQIKDYTFGTF